MSTEIESLKNILSELFAKLVNFALDEDLLQDLGESLEIFYNLQEGEEYEFDPSEEFLFLSWFLLDDCDHVDYSLINEFMQAYSDKLSIQEMQICQALKYTHLSLLKVIDVTPNNKILLKDVFLGEEFEVTETTKIDADIKEHLLYTRVLKIGDIRFLVGAGIFLDPSVTEHLTTFVAEQFKQDCEDGFPQSFKDFLKYNAEIINWWIRGYERGELNDNQPTMDDNPQKQDPPKPPKPPKTPKPPKSPTKK